MKMVHGFLNDEELAAAMLLEMDNNESEQKDLKARCLPLEKAGLSKSKTVISKLSQSGELAAVPENGPPSPSEIAAAILRKKSFRWLGPKRV
jgi:hypothetical protein